LGKQPITLKASIPDEDIPDTTIALIRAAVGDDAHKTLLEALGGTQLYIPAKVGEHHPLAQAMGLEAARQLSSKLAGVTITLPVTLRKRALIEEGLRNGDPVLKIAVRAVCSPRFVWKVKAEMVEAKEPDQLGLF
jgi:hypothetical protein